MADANFDDMRESLKETRIVLDQAAKVILKHSEILAEHDQRMAEHDQRMAEHDERMDRVARHLEVLADIADGLIRDKADRKKR